MSNSLPRRRGLRALTCSYYAPSTAATIFQHPVAFVPQLFYGLVVLRPLVWSTIYFSIGKEELSTVLRRLRICCAEQRRACTICHRDRARHDMPMHHLPNESPKQGRVRTLEVGRDDARMKREGGNPFRAVAIVYCASLHDNGNLRVCVAFPAVAN